MKCLFTGCRKPAVWECRKLWRAGSIFTCDQHKPDPSSRPPTLQHLPFAYEVTPIETQEEASHDRYR